MTENSIKMDNLKVLMICSNFYPIFRGMERQAFQLSKHLINCGAKVRILTQQIKDTPDFEIVDGIQIFRKIKPLNFSPLYTFSYLWSVYNFLKKNSDLYDIIHCHQIYLYTISGVWAGSKLRKPVLAKVVSSGYLSDLTRLRKVRFSKLFIKDVFRISAMVATCEKIKAEAINDGFLPSKIFKIPNGVDVNHYKPIISIKGNLRKVLFVGRLDDEIKGLHFIIQGFAKAYKNFPEIELHVVGDGKDREKLIKLALDLNLQTKVIFHLDVKDPLRFYQESDVLILGSKTEGMSNVLLEAMSCGLPCISTAVGGSSEILHPDGKGDAPILKDGEIFKSDYGVLVPYGSSDSIAQAIEALIKEPELLKKYSISSRERMTANFSFEKITKDYLNLYSKLLEDMK